MNRIFFLFCLLGFLLISLNVIGQSNIEQLQSQLDTASESDKANIYNQLSQLYFNTDDDAKSLENAKNALRSAKVSKNVNEEAAAHINLGLLNSKTGKYQEAIEDFKSSLAIHETHDSKTGVGYNYIQIGLG